MPHQQNFDFFLVIDFEATCDDKDARWRNEIIEFPIVVLEADTGCVVAEFREYIKPILNPTLTQLALGGSLALGVGIAIVTCGDWDMQTMLSRQARMTGVKVPEIFREWVNIKITFKDVTGEPGLGMAQMLDALQLELVGRHHSGLDDVRNIAT